MSKQIPVPQDFDMRREYFQKFGASALHDAHLLTVYIDESLAQECDMISPTQLLMREPFSKSGFNLQNFTNNGQYNPELQNDLQFSQNSKLSAMIQNLPMYYGFWGTIYNTVLDNKPVETYDLIQKWIDTASGNFTQIFESSTEANEGKKLKRPTTNYVITTLTDSQAQLLLTDCQVAELQGSVRKFVCSRKCSTEQQNMNDMYRFPVQSNGCVDSITTRVGQNIHDPSNLYKTPLTGLIEREELKLSKPQPKKIDVKPPPPKKEPKKFDKDGNEIKPKKKKVPLNRDMYVTPEQKFCMPAMPEVQLFDQKVSQTTPICSFCAAPLRFNIQPCRIPAKFKQYVTGASQLLQKDLNTDQVNKISQQHNNYQVKVGGKMQSSVKTIPQYHFVLLEIGYNKNYQKVHEENIRTILSMKGNGVLIRIAKPSDEAKTFEFDGIEQVKTNMQLDQNFNINSYCYCIESNSIRQGVIDLMDMFESRANWIAEWDDLKKRNAKYFPKNKK